MAKQQQQWAANNRQIAGVLGLKPKPAQLKEIGAWFKLPGFPKKQARGYPVIELKEWHLGFLKRSEVRGQRSDGKKQKPDVSADLRPQTADLSPRSDAPGAHEDLFNLSPEQLSEANKQRLLRNRAIHLGLFPGEPLKVNAINELIEHGLIPKIDEQFKDGAGRTGDLPNGAHGVTRPTWNGGTGAALPLSLPSQTAMAAFLQERYSFPVAEIDMSDWKTGKRKPVPDAPLMPGPKPRGSYTAPMVAATVAWFEQWVVNPAKAAAGAGQLTLGDIGLSARATNAKMQQDIDAAALKRLELEQAQRADDKNYISRAEHLSLCEGGNKIVSAVVTYAIETSLVSKFKAHPTIMALADDLRANVMEAMRTVSIGVNQELHAEIPRRLLEIEHQQ